MKQLTEYACVVAVVLSALKIGDQISWNWLWVTSPLWMMAATFLTALVFVSCWTALGSPRYLTLRLKEKKLAKEMKRQREARKRELDKQWALMETSRWYNR